MCTSRCSQAGAEWRDRATSGQDTTRTRGSQLAGRLHKQVEVEISRTNYRKRHDFHWVLKNRSQSGKEESDLSRETSSCEKTMNTGKWKLFDEL